MFAVRRPNFSGIARDGTRLSPLLDVWTVEKAGNCMQDLDRVAAREAL
jgi:hypothetical protein